MKYIKRQGNLWKCVVYILAFGLSISNPPPVLAQSADELDIKAAFLFNFSKFVEWPASDSSLPFVIGIIGDDPFGSTIDELLRGKSVLGRGLQIRRLKEPLEARKCQIVFARAAEREKAMQVLEAVKGYPVLTVGETREFLQMGGMIYFVTDDNRVNLTISGIAAEHANLKISAKLMMLARPFKN